MKYHTVVIVALKTEVEGLVIRDDIPILFCGVGKVNAAIKTMEAIHKYNPNHIINYGSAGSFKHQQGDIIKCKRFHQRDIDLSPLGFNLGETPFEEDIPNIISFVNNPKSPICASGDNFVTNNEQTFFIADALEMEAYAIAKACYKHKINFTAYKYISDGADKNAAIDWNKQCHLGMEKFKVIYEKIIRVNGMTPDSIPAE